MYCSWQTHTWGIPLIHPEESGGLIWVRRSVLEWQLKEGMDTVTKIVLSSRNAPKCKSTDMNITMCLPRRPTQLLSASQTCSRPSPRTQRIRFLLNCVASREAINSSRRFHSMQSLPLCPPGLYYILIHSGRKKKKKTLTGNFHLSLTTTATMISWSHDFSSQ